MNLTEFLHGIYGDGRVRLPLVGIEGESASFSADDLREADGVLAELEAVERLEFPFEAPEFAPPAAQWAARMLYRACQFTVDREASKEIVIRVLGEPCPVEVCPQAVYSVDLAFRFLPDVKRHVRTMPDDDPVVTAVAGWASQWPFSSVGVPGVLPIDVDVVLGHAGLRRKYADRVILAGDSERGNDVATKTAIDEAVGAHAGLAGALESRRLGSSK